MIGVIATISVHKGKEIEFQDIMKKLVNDVHKYLRTSQKTRFGICYK